MKQIRLLIAEDHEMVREGLRTLIELNNHILVVGEASTGRMAVDMCQTLKPDIVLLDIAMPLLNGFEAARQIISASRSVKVLVLSAHADDEYVDRMLTLGVSGYIVKQNPGKVLLKAIEEIDKGRTYFSASIARRLALANVHAHEQGRKKTERTVALTSREAEVLQCVAEGSPNKSIASHLGISIKTVEKHRQHLMDKLNIHDTAGLTRHAIATGVIESTKRLPH